MFAELWNCGWAVEGPEAGFRVNGMVQEGYVAITAKGFGVGTDKGVVDVREEFYVLLVVSQQRYHHRLKMCLNQRTHHWQRALQSCIRSHEL